MIYLNELSAKCRFLKQISSVVWSQWQGRKAGKILRVWSAKGAVGVNGTETCCCLDWEKLLSSLLLQSEDWGKTQARREVGHCCSFWLWDFLFGKNATKASFQRPEWMLEERARKKARGEKTSAPCSDSVCLSSLLVGQNSWPKKREQPQGEEQWFQCAPQHCWSQGIPVCAVPTTHLSPKTGDSVGGSLSRAQVREISRKMCLAGGLHSGHKHSRMLLVAVCEYVWNYLLNFTLIAPQFILDCIYYAKLTFDSLGNSYWKRWGISMEHRFSLRGKGIK